MRTLVRFFLWLALCLADGVNYARFLILLFIVILISPCPAEIIPDARRIDWTSVGVLGGIPTRTTIGANAVSDYGADPTGATNSRTAILNTLDNTPEGQVAYLPAGTYRIIGTISMQFVHGKTLRGAGMGLTTLKFEIDPANGSFGMSGDYPDHTPSITVISGATKGSSNVVVNVTTGTAVGRLLTISDLNPTWVHYDAALYGAGPSNDGHDTTRLLNSTHRITAINGTTITVWPPLPWWFTNSPAITPWTYYLNGFGIEDLTFDCINSLATAPVFFSQTYDCWLKGVEIKNSSRRQTWWFKAVNCEMRECYTHDTIGTGPNHEGLDLVQNCCFNLIENNICIAAGKPAIMIGDWGGGCNGNVIGYNYFVASLTNGTALECSISANHGPHNMMNLVEGNIGQSIKSDGYYGSMSHLTVFRNYWSGDYDAAQYNWPLAVQLCKWSYYCNFVGNVLGKSGLGQHYTLTNVNYSQSSNVIWQLGYPATGHTSYYLEYPGTPDDPGASDPDYTGMRDLAVASSLIRHGNFDYATASTIWDAGIADHALPASFYLSAKPSWWGSAPWPSVGPDVSPIVGPIPALMRYYGTNYGSVASPPWDSEFKTIQLNVGTVIIIVVP